MGDRGKTKANVRSAWYTLVPCTCDYKYGSVPVRSRPMPDEVRVFMDEIIRAAWLSGKFVGNSLNVNVYPDGESGIPWHADDEDLFPDENDETTILSLSPGGTRSFEIR